MRNAKLEDRIIISPDRLGPEGAAEAVKVLADRVSWFSVGSALFHSVGGQAGVALLKESGARKILYNAAFSDPPGICYSETKMVLKYGVDIITVNASAGEEVLGAVIKARDEVAPETQVFLSLLPTFIGNDTQALKTYGDTVARLTGKYAERARNPAVTGVIGAASDIWHVRESVTRSTLQVIVTGIRTASSGEAGRFSTPVQALKAGADWLWIGEEVTYASDGPSAALDRIVASLRAAL